MMLESKAPNYDTYGLLRTSYSRNPAYYIILQPSYQKSLPLFRFPPFLLDFFSYNKCNFLTIPTIVLPPGMASSSRFPIAPSLITRPK